MLNTLYPVLSQEDSQNKHKAASFHFECEGIPIHNRGKSKGASYFECSSHRLVNAPDCHFRAKITNLSFDTPSGSIEIIQEYSKSCKFILGNDTKDFLKLQIKQIIQNFTRL